jgi:hypothetical protein
MNAPGLHAKIISDDGRAAALASSARTPREIVEELYLLAYSRTPTADERAVAEGLFQGAAGASANRRRATEDLLWALLNSAEFLFKD